MARRIFWGKSQNWVFNPTTGNGVANAPVTFWTRRTGGTQVTDLQFVDDDGVLTGAVPSGTITADANGFLPSFAGPNDGRVYLWADGGQAGGRRLVEASMAAAVGDASSVVLGDGSLLAVSTFSQPGHVHALADLPAGSMFFRRYSGSWPARGSARTDLVCVWIKDNAADPDPAIDSTFALTNVDILWRQT